MIADRAALKTEIVCVTRSHPSLPDLTSGSLRRSGAPSAVNLPFGPGRRVG
jgi:hypothetical protein